MGGTTTSIVNTGELEAQLTALIEQGYDVYIWVGGNDVRIAALEANASLTANDWTYRLTDSFSTKPTGYYDTAAGAALDDFEDNDITDWTAAGGSAVVSSTVYKNGAYAAQISGGCQFKKLMTLGSDVWVGEWFRVSARSTVDGTPQSSFYLLDEDGSTFIGGMRIQGEGGTSAVFRYENGSYNAMTGTDDCEVDTWYFLRLRHNSGADTMDAEVYNSSGTLLCYLYDQTPSNAAQTPGMVWHEGDSDSGNTFIDDICKGFVTEVNITWNSAGYHAGNGKTVKINQITGTYNITNIFVYCDYAGTVAFDYATDGGTVYTEDQALNTLIEIPSDSSLLPYLLQAE